MKFNRLKKTSFLLLLLSNLFFISEISAQSVNGLWYGVGRVSKFGDNNTYLSELKLKQSGKKVTGDFNYFFRRNEIKTKISGTYDSKTRTLFLNTNPILNFQAKDPNGADCPMKGVFRLTASRVETTLSGDFTATSTYKLTCPDIAVKFVKGNNFNPVPEDTVVQVTASAAVQPKKVIATVAPVKLYKQIDP